MSTTSIQEGVSYQCQRKCYYGPVKSVTVACNEYFEGISSKSELENKRKGRFFLSFSQKKNVANGLDTKEIHSLMDVATGLLAVSLAPMRLLYLESYVKFICRE